MRALISGILSLCIGGSAAAETPLARPLPWLGFGADGGLIILEALPLFEIPKSIWQEEDFQERSEAFLDASLAKWLGPDARVVAVDPREGKDFFVRAAPRPGPADPRVGQRLEVWGAEGMGSRAGSGS